MLTLLSLHLSEPLYPGKFGLELRQLLQKYSSKSQKTLGYQRAREEIYSYVYNDPTDQAVYCVYSGSRMPCAYNSMDTSCNADLNCEHTVPQSFFNKQDPMVSDIHHLRTAWSKANNGRQNYPFKRLNGTSGTFFGPNFTQTTKQPPQIENWSILDKGKFMPRQVQMGDTARAIAYFYTRYPTEAGNITKVINVDEMIEWDQEFEPTDSQYQQYLRAVQVQKNRNPYYEEKGLVARAYCDISTKFPCSQYQ
ncbi:Extracellular_nuclease [Hexamita inflata]|uniref:Extracellular nuclease n=1 Tax=Hexamita inflata TaxID=28002 RepID=A0AA86THP6_9EUKA|nr:Extracellular nuclease [Hexamita inflata]